MALKAGAPRNLVSPESWLPKCAQKADVPRNLVQKHYALNADFPALIDRIPESWPEKN